MTDKLIEPKLTKPKLVEAPPKFTPCSQCGHPGGCIQADCCEKGFK